MMKIIKIIMLAFLMSVGTNLMAQKIDSKKSIVNFKVPKTEGTISGMKGDIKFDESDLENSYFKVSIDANTINTENKKRDNHLRTEDFFYVEVFPEITFTSKSITKVGDHYETEGVLQLHGIEQTVKITFKVAESDNGKKLVGQLHIDQQDYEMANKEKLVDIEIICYLN